MSDPDRMPWVRNREIFQRLYPAIKKMDPLDQLRIMWLLTIQEPRYCEMPEFVEWVNTATKSGPGERLLASTPLDDIHAILLGEEERK